MFLGSGMKVSEQVGIRPVFINMFLGSTVSVSEQVGFIDMFLGSVVSVSEQVGISINCSSGLSLSEGWGASCPGWFILPPPRISVKQCHQLILIAP